MPTLTIDGKEVTVEPGSTLLQACEAAGAEIPRFCYHERLSIAGNCRMCLVEVEKAPKPVASCAMPAGDGMVIHTNTPAVKKSREGVMEFLLINHPLDCPICDQGGECDLQDQSVAYGRGSSRYDENKRAVREKNMGPLIKTVMTRCIHCTRCIRFATEIAGVEELGAIGRGEHMEITTYLEKTLASELSANVIDLCPVGALTSKPYAFAARPWELAKTESIDVMDAMGSNIRVDARGNQVMRVLPRLHEDVNEEWISDKTRYAVDGLSFRRLDRPWVRRHGRLEKADWPTAFAAIRRGLDGVRGDALAGVVGDLQDMESMLALKDLFTDLDSARIECRQDGAGLDPATPAGYRFNSGFTGVDKADVLLLVGTNPRLEAPVLNARIRANVVERGLPVLRIGTSDDLTYHVDHLGNRNSILEDILNGNSEVGDLLKSAERGMIILGMGALQGEDGPDILGAARAIADRYGLVTAGWNGFNVLHTAAARVGALDLDLACEGGIRGILADAKAGKLKAAILLGADEFDTRALKDVFTVYIGSHGDQGVRHADVILPGAAYTEKSGTYMNTEGRAQRTLGAVFPPGDAREDWTILRALSDVLGSELGYDTLGELRSRLAIVAPQSSALDEITAAEWGEFGSTGELGTGTMRSAIDDFYLTNPIARASQTMAECVAARDGTAEQGTGTDG